MAGVAGLGVGTVTLVCGALCGAAAGDGLVVVSGDEAGAVVCCPMALHVTTREAVIIHFKVRMTQILSVLLSAPARYPTQYRSSVRQLENHMYGRRRIYGLIVVLGRLETHFICRFDRRFVQAMTHASPHAIHVQLTVCLKH